MGGAKAIRQGLVTDGLDLNLQNIKATTKSFKSSVGIRTQLIRYISDYISEEIGLGKK